jgi:hypothetical protein
VIAAGRPASWALLGIPNRNPSRAPTAVAAAASMIVTLRIEDRAAGVESG